MIWLFERGHEAIRLETRFDRPSDEYTISITWADAATTMERYPAFAEFHARIMALEQRFSTDHWAQVGSAQIIPGDWRGP